MYQRSVFILFISFFFLACSSKKVKDESVVDDKTKEKGSKVEWTYSGAFGPQFWGDLDPSFVTCKEGMHQSPIDLIWKKPASPNPFAHIYSPVNASVTDNGYAIELSTSPGSSVKMRNNIYSLRNMRIHSPSEHTISGKSYPLELHFIHQNDRGFITVVGVLVVEGKAHAGAQQIVEALPSARNTSKEMEGLFNPADFIPQIKTFYNYAGSLTAPPCSEGVNRIVFNTPIEFSSEQIAALKNRYAMNNRPIQPLNDRVMINYAE